MASPRGFEHPLKSKTYGNILCLPTVIPTIIQSQISFLPIFQLLWAGY